MGNDFNILKMFKILLQKKIYNFKLSFISNNNFL